MRLRKLALKTVKLAEFQHLRWHAHKTSFLKICDLSYSLYYTAALGNYRGRTAKTRASNLPAAAG